MVEITSFSFEIFNVFFSKADCKAISLSTPKEEAYESSSSKLTPVIANVTVFYRLM